MTAFSIKLAIRLVFFSLFFVSILFSFTSVKADASVSEKNSIRNQIFAYRSNFRWCGWNPHLPNPDIVQLTVGANVVAEELADGVPVNYNYNEELGDQLAQNNDFPDLNAKWFDFDGQNYNQALMNWMNSVDSCNAIMSTKMARIGVGKSSLGGGNFRWILLIYEEGIFNEEDDDLGFSNSITTRSGGRPEVPLMALYLPQQNDRNVPFSLSSNDKPDLVATELSILGNINKSDPDNYHARIRLTIENQGTSKASKFSIGVLASTGPNSLEIPVPFVVSNFQSDTWMPLNHSEVFPGESVVIEGEIFFHPSLKGKTIQVLALADACSEGDSCAINEIDESNNRSNTLLLDLSIPNVKKKFSHIRFGNVVHGRTPLLR